MKTSPVLKFGFIALSVIVLATACDKAKTIESITPEDPIVVKPGSDEGEIIQDQYIIHLKEDFIKPAISYTEGKNFSTREEKGKFMEAKNALVKAELKEFLTQQNFENADVLHLYTVSKAGFAIKLNPEDYAQIQRNSTVESIEHDRMQYIPEYTIESIDNSGSRFQTTPCGINRAGGSTNATPGKWAWVIDSGVDTDHSDLNVSTSPTYSRTFVGSSVEDCNGHGTHVAGIIGAIDNNRGVRGVAANALIVPVRVFGCTGGSPTSRIVSALNHVATYSISGDVVNMSLGGRFGAGCSSNTAYRSILLSLSNSGTRVVMSAGNDAAHAGNYQPGCVNNTRLYTVASMKCNRSWSSFSNWGIAPIDWIAVGHRVRSTYLNGGYARLSGTSMAAPHVAGIVQVRQNGPRRNGTVTRNGVNYRIATH